MATDLMNKWEPSRLGESYSVRLSRTLVITVSREAQSHDNPSTTPYAATVFGARLTRRFATLDEAKEAAITFAKSELERARKASNI